MATPPSLESLCSIPNVQGIVRCSGDQDLLEASNSEAEVFGNVLTYFRQVSSLIGESLGLENLEESQLQGQSTTAVCLPLEAQTLGLLLGSRQRSAETVSKVLTLVKGN